MPVFRPSRVQKIKSIICRATLDWNHENEYNGLDWYLTKHGILHLLDQERIGDAKQRMLDIHFMAEFSKSLRDCGGAVEKPFVLLVLQTWDEGFVM